MQHAGINLINQNNNNNNNNKKKKKKNELTKFVDRSKITKEKYKRLRCILLIDFL